MSISFHYLFIPVSARNLTFAQSSLSQQTPKIMPHTLRQIRRCWTQNFAKVMIRALTYGEGPGYMWHRRLVVEMWHHRPGLPVMELPKTRQWRILGTIYWSSWCLAVLFLNAKSMHMKILIGKDGINRFHHYFIVFPDNSMVYGLPKRSTAVASSESFGCL